MIPVETALAHVLALAPAPATETVALRNAAGRVLARDIRARAGQPPFAAAAMDGYAVTAATPGTGLRVIGESRAGARFAGRVRPGEAVRIFTGAPVPEGATRVVIQEDVTRDGDLVTPGPGMDDKDNIRPAGADFAAGAVIAAPRLLRAADVALIAAMNHGEVEVNRRPVVALIATGDELVMPGETPGPDQIIASNAFALEAMARACGAEARLLPVARDTGESLAQVIGLARDADLIVTIGGASVGEHDLVGGVLDALGMTRAFYKVAIRPGKPLMAGRLGSAAVLGLPGNPVSAIVCGHVFMCPLLRRMQGLDAAVAAPRRGRLAGALPANGPRSHYMRAALLGTDTDGIARLEVFDDQDSARLWLLTRADTLVIRPPDDPPRAAGAPVDWMPI